MKSSRGSAQSAACKLEVIAKPRAKHSRVVAARPGTVEVALAAPPVDGAANTELLRFLAERLRVPRRALTLLRGAGSRHKQIEIFGLSADEVLARLAPDE